MIEDPRPTHYRYDFKGVKLDPYRVMDLYGITHPAHQHAVKKLLRAGRGDHRDIIGDIDGAISALTRWKEMLAEDNGEG